MELSRKQVIEILEKADATVNKEPKTITAQALEYAISSLKTDEMYQLMYEGIANIIIPKDLTNGDVFNLVLDVDKDCIEVNGENGTMTFTVTQEWWNSPYKGADK